MTKTAPQSWFSSHQGSEWVAHPFNRLAWFLNDRADEIEDDTFYELINELQHIYDLEFMDLEEVKTRTAEDQKLMEKAHHNLYERLLKQWQKKQKEDPNYMPIFEQEEEGVKNPSIYDLGYNAHQISEMTVKEYDRLKKLAEKKKEEPSKEEASVKPKRKVSTSKTKEKPLAKKKTTITKKTTSTRSKATKTKLKVAK